MSEELRDWGRPLILVEGPHALEPPDDGGGGNRFEGTDGTV